MILRKPKLLGHRDLRRQQRGGLDLAVEQRLQPRAEAAGVDGLDVLERQIFFQPVGHVEMAAGAHADRDRNVLQILRLADLGIRPHEDRPGRIAVGLGTNLPMPAEALQIEPQTQAPWITSALSLV